jgi:hypothetical protein
VVDLSYHDVFEVNTDNLKPHEYEKIVWNLLDKGFEIISESPLSEYDYDNENFDDFPIAS